MSGAWTNAHNTNWLRHLPAGSSAARELQLAAKSLSGAGEEPSSEQMLAQRKVISMRRWLQALGLGSATFHHTEQVCNHCPKGSAACGTTSSFTGQKELELLVLWKFLQVLVFSGAEQSSSASPCQSCAPLPTPAGPSALLPTLPREPAV